MPSYPRQKRRRRLWREQLVEWSAQKNNMMKPKVRLSMMKAKKMLHDGEVRGHEITEKQRRFFGAIAGGAKPRAKKK